MESKNIMDEVVSIPTAQEVDPSTLVDSGNVTEIKEDGPDAASTAIGNNTDLSKYVRPRKTRTVIRENNKKIGRNDPCPCGSGKKYKNCCLKKGNDWNSTRELTAQEMAQIKFGTKMPQYFKN